MNRSTTYDNMEDEFPSKVSFNELTTYWKGTHQYEVMIKKKHKIFSLGYQPYWFVYGKSKCIHIFENPSANFPYLVTELKNMKYMTIDKSTIKLWNKKKNLVIIFVKEEDKLYFDEFYKNTCR